LFDETPLVLVDTKELLQAVADRLGRARVIGVDTESDSFHHYQEKVCLLQFSDLEGDMIVDPLAVGGDLSPLAPVFANPDVIKIFHGADYDIVCLKRDYGFEIRNLFDTMIASQQLGIGRIGLADLIGEFFGIDIDKKYQRHDWASRPLWPEHIEYARGDTHWLLALREILERRLVKAGRLARVREECRILESREWEGRRFDPDGWTRMKTRGVKLDDDGRHVLRFLWRYRDEQAKQLDRPAFKVIPDEVLVEVADRRPASDAELEKLFPRSKAAMKRRHGPAFLKAVKDGLEDDVPLPVPGSKRPKGPRPRLAGRNADVAFEALKAWRNDLVSATPGLNPLAVASNTVLKNVAKMRPFDLAELAAVPDVRQWQVESHGETLLAVLEKAVPKDQVKEGGEEEESDGEAADSGRRRRRRRRRTTTGD
jgi:ribonuclease D